MSFYTSLSGLKGSQTEMSTISHNLANVSTNGFKKSRTEFADVIASSVSVNPNQMVGSGSVVKAIRQEFSQGGLVQSESSLDLAVSGDGFFVVKPDLEGSKVNYTRNGGFMVDPDRYVVDANGGHLQVYPVDGSGTVVATGAGATTSLRVPAFSGTPKATGAVSQSLNLSGNASVPSSNPVFTTANPYAFDRFNPATYNNSTQTTVYDTDGNAMTMTSYFVRETAPAVVPPATVAPLGPSTWKVYTFVGDQQLDADAGTAGANPITLSFDVNGALTAPTGATTFGEFTPTGAAKPQTISLDFGSATTQLAQPFDLVAQSQDGAAVGKLEGLSVDENGMVRATFSNGDSQALGMVALANFSNPSGLRQLGNSYWSPTGLSGDPRMGQPGADGFGALMSGAIERSNVDITEELVNLIAAQRNFQANAKALDASSQISQSIFNIRS
ncbi:flagellar hook protein FlgE [Sphingomonas cannabina]|uniref:flagellar hook protein FlgE n=1 Tax=Sphingomonas cannabina TaxID=2899123 RepID=UPI001F218A5F|nr:flagellar hook protein FlgE [Sphingomonas cannabina]UIJ45456.1 flagellar hook protein FlgE [Sphingomonas cannabina]